ncbi:sensor domain-containing diguanylate cyclase [Aliarcobacter cryaerophilus]|uniref:sensor domain-containing diguanylate cyclase n=1 Tax=Aliarcobacter cryaerophilus TaxID=28198 RepID=UPI003DA5403F
MPENLKKSIIKTFATEWFLYIFFLIIITIFIVFTIIFERQQVIKREENRLSTQVKIVNDNILMQIYSVNEAFKNIKTVIDKKNDLISNLKLFVNVIPSVRTFLIMDKNGNVIASSRDDLTTFNYSSRDYFKTVKNNPVENKLFISSPYISVLGTLNINIVTPFFDDKKNFAGIILAAFDPDALSNLLTSVIYADDMKASIIHGDGTLFLTIPNNPLMVGKKLLYNQGLLSKHISSGNISNTFKGLTYAGEDNRILSLYSIIPNELDINATLYVSVSRNINTLYADIKNEIIVMAILYFLLLVFSVPWIFFLQKRRYILLQFEIKNREESRKRLEELAYIDSLTKIANRRYFEEFLEKEWNYCKRNQRELSIILLDIDFFKQYNDTYGHQAGDLCLQKIASCLDDELNRSHDLVARYGGEEFICILPNTNKFDAINIATKLKIAVQNLEIPHENSRISSIVTISLGVSTVIPKDKLEKTKLIKKADNALYLAKENGRNRVEFEEF